MATITPFLSEIGIFSFNFAPRGWALCNGPVLPINQNQPLFALLGTTYGGDGRVNFALPNLEGRVPMHTGNGHNLGEKAGQESHVLTASEMAAHIHVPQADAKAGNGNSFNPANAFPADTSPVLAYSSGSANMVAMSPAMVSSLGGGQAHENRQPSLTLTYCIAIQGVFPSRS
jgi:microcystin-dependent protein